MIYQPLISIIIPVFNVEKYVYKCIESIMLQTFSNFELICVDDGSQDDSLEIINKFKEKDARIRILMQENLGAAAARNAGLAIAQGKYVMFLDSDDFFKHDMLENLYLVAEKYQAEVVEFGYYEYDNVSGDIRAAKVMNILPIKTSAEKLGDKIFKVCEPMPWTKFLLKSFIISNNLEYQNIPVFNDEYFNRMAVCLANRLVILNKRFVYYRINNEKSLQGNNQKKIFYLAYFAAHLKKEMVKRNIFSGNFREAYFSYILYRLTDAFMCVCDNSTKRELYEYLKVYGVGNIVESIEDAKRNILFYNLLVSKNYEEYLLYIIKYQKDNGVLKSSKTYIIGNLVLWLPRKIRNIIYKWW